MTTDSYIPGIVIQGPLISKGRVPRSEGIPIPNLKKSDNFIISSGKKIFLKQFINEAFKYLKIDYKKYVFEDSLKIIRKNKKRIGDSTLLYSKTGWKPKFTLKEIVKEMIDHELSLYF